MAGLTQEILRNCTDYRLKHDVGASCSSTLSIYGRFIITGLCDFNQLEEEEDGKKAAGGRRMNIDEEHESTLVRGLLCHPN